MSRIVLSVKNPQAIKRAIGIISQKRLVNLIVGSYRFGQFACEVNVSRLMLLLKTQGEELNEIPVISGEGIGMKALSVSNIYQISFIVNENPGLCPMQ